MKINQDFKEQVIKCLDSRLNAIGGYDSIIWKIRAGYLGILYSTLGLLIGTNGEMTISELSEMKELILLLVIGFSISAYIIDYAYVRKKLRVVISRDKLMSLFLENETIEVNLLKISGEMDLHESQDDEMKNDYYKKRNWNIRWILIPLYLTTPIIVLIIILLVRLATSGNYL